MLRRASQGCFLGIIILALLSAGILVAIYLATDGQIFNVAQTLILRVQLNSRQEELNTPYSSDASPIRFHIPAGTLAGAISSALANAALIQDPDLFVDYARAEGYDRRFEAGVYFLNRTQSISQIAAILTDSSKSFIAFRTLEGARIEELADLIDLNGLFGFTGANFLALVDEGAALPADFATWAGIPAGASLEGFMFPDTYQLPPDIATEGLRDTLLRTFRDRVGDTLSGDALAQDFTMHQVVTLASIIERGGSLAR